MHGISRRMSALPGFKLLTASLILVAGLAGNASCAWNLAPGTSGMFMQSLFASGNTVYAGTQDKGLFTLAADGTGFKAGPASLAAEKVSGFAQSGSRIYAGTSLGVFVTEDAGAQWKRLSNESNTDGVISIAASGTTVFAGTFLGLYISRNSGTDWTEVTNGPSTGDWVESISITGNHVFLGVAEGFFGSKRIWHSSDLGATWKTITYASMDARPEKVLALGNNLLVSTQDSLYYSPDLGATWTKSPAQAKVFGQSTFFNAMDYAAGTILTDRGDSTFLSSDSGKTWIQIRGVPEAPYAFTITDGFAFTGTVSDGSQGLYFAPRSGIAAIRTLAHAITKARIDEPLLWIGGGRMLTSGSNGSGSAMGKRVVDPLGRIPYVGATGSKN